MEAQKLKTNLKGLSKKELKSLIEKINSITESSTNETAGNEAMILLEQIEMELNKISSKP